MQTPRTRLCATALFALAAGPVLPLAAQQLSSAAAQRRVLDQYCVVCHNQKAKTAGLMLDKMDLDHVSDGAETWEKVIRKLRGGMMPPQGMPRPDEATMDRLISWLENELDRAAAQHPNSGRDSLHRLNRTEYANAIRDLLALDIE